MRKEKAGRKCLTALLVAILVVMSTRLNVTAAAPGVLTITEKESGKVWDTKQQLDIFESTYYGGKVIAPGSKGTYSFLVQNQTELAATCQISFTEQNSAGAPIRYRLLENGNDLLGNNSTWLDVSGLEHVTRSFAPGEKTEYTLEWKWDTTDDAADTLIGIAARNGLTYTLNINVTGEQESTGNTPKTGDGAGTDLLAMTGILATLSISVMVLLRYRTVKQKREGRP